MRNHSVRLACAALAGLAAAVGCGRRGGADAGAADSAPVASATDLTAFHGAVLTPPRPKPDFTLTSMDGTPYRFRERTDGYATLLFFGYTHCPDICPVHMANLGAVMKKLPARVTERLRVVFVTTDPKRDTPERLKSWLGHFDPSFMGLTGTEAEIRQAEAAVGLPPAQIDSVAAKTDTGYTVGHAALIIAYTPDNLARVMYPFGVRQSDWAHDLPRLVDMSAAGIEVQNARVLATPDAPMAVAYFTVHNGGDTPVTLRSVSSERAAQVGLHQQRRSGNMVRMQPLGPLTIPAGRSLVLEPGGVHVMLGGIKPTVSPGDSLSLTLKFDGRDDVTVAAPVRSYASEEQ